MKANYRKYNGRTQNFSTYHKKDGTNVRAILKVQTKQEGETRMTYKQVVETLDQLQAMFDNTKKELKVLGLLKNGIEQEGWGFGNKTFSA